MEKLRTLEDVEFEMGQLAVRAGMASYNIRKAEKDLKLIHDQLDELNFEAIKLRGERK